MGKAQRGLLGFVAGRGAKSVATLSLLNPRQFEMKVSDGFRLRGFEVARYEGSSDHGVQLVVTKGGVRHLVRCEQWRAQSITVTVIQDLAGVMVREGALGGFVVSSGRFTREARELAGLSRIQLYDEKNIDEIVER